MNPQEEERIQKRIARYQQGIFALALYLIGGDKNAAYDITVSAFTKALPIVNSLTFDEETFLIRLVSEAVAQIRKARVMPAYDGSDFTHLSGEKQKVLETTRKALMALGLEDKITLITQPVSKS